jgi:hypothetical protein
MTYHPQIVPAVEKELNFFSKKFDKGLRYYLEQLGECGFNQITGEGSADYLTYSFIPQKLKTLLPDVKFIVLLRNPITRYYSQLAHRYNNAIRLGTTTATFFEFLDYMISKLNEEQGEQDSQIKEWGQYAKYIKHWFKFFPKKQFIFIKSEDFFKDHNIEINKVFHFLNLPRYKVPLATKLVGYYPEIPKKYKKILKEYYKPYNKELYKLLNRDFGWEKE